MEFEWDAAKNAINLGKHGLDFEEAEAIFNGRTLTREDRRFDYGEPRFVSIGAIAAGGVVVVVHTLRAPRTPVISARLANP